MYMMNNNTIKKMKQDNRIDLIAKKMSEEKGKT